MTCLRALVLEDEWPARNYLVQLIQETKLAEVVGAVASVAEAREALAGLQPDVVFVDVQLRCGENGLDLVESTISSRPESARPAFVLATAYSEHAKRARELGVVDHLLKPFSEELVEACLRRLMSRRPARSTPFRVLARREHGLVFLDPADIWAFEASARSSTVHSRLGKFELDLSLASIETSFGRTLARVHRDWLVNLGVARVLEPGNGETVLLIPSPGDESERVRIPVSPDRAPALRDLLANAAGSHPK